MKILSNKNSTKKFKILQSKDFVKQKFHKEI